MADTPTESTPEKKTFSLKPNETELIRGELNRHNAALASLLSFIAVERLAYQVNQETAFTLSLDMKELQVWQNTPEPEVKPVDLGDGKSETAKALEGGNPDEVMSMYEDKTTKEPN